MVTAACDSLIGRIPRDEPTPADPTGTLSATYDAWHRQVEVRADDAGSPGAIIAAYRRDGLNRRIVKLLGANPADPDVRFDYYYNTGWQVLEERKDGGATAYAQYVWSLRYIDAPVLRDRDADADPDTGHLGVADSGLDERLFYTTDANMNVTALVQGTPGHQDLGEVVERCVYDPYGTVTFLAADWTPLGPNESAYANEILFAGYRFNPETGHYDVRERPYAPRLGWTVRDLIPYPDGMNNYQYVASLPTTYRDPAGQQLEMDSGTGIVTTFRNGHSTTQFDRNRVDFQYENELFCGNYARNMPRIERAVEDLNQPPHLRRGVTTDDQHIIAACNQRCPNNAKCCECTREKCQDELREILALYTERVTAEAEARNLGFFSTWLFGNLLKFFGADTLRCDDWQNIAQGAVNKDWKCWNVGKATSTGILIDHAFVILNHCCNEDKTAPDIVLDPWHSGTPRWFPKGTHGYAIDPDKTY